MRAANFEITFAELLEFYTTKGKPLLPTFAFIDPFGWVGVPLAVVKQILNYESCEVLLTLMYEEINRFHRSSRRACVPRPVSARSACIGLDRVDATASCGVPCRGCHSEKRTAWKTGGSVDEIVEYLGVSRDTVYNWIATPAHRVGSLWKFNEAVEAWVLSGGADGVEPSTTPEAAPTDDRAAGNRDSTKARTSKRGRKSR